MQNFNKAKWFVMKIGNKSLTICFKGIDIQPIRHNLPHNLLIGPGEERSWMEIYKHNLTTLETGIAIRK